LIERIPGLLFTAQPETPAYVLAGTSGWAADDQVICLLAAYNSTPIISQRSQTGSPGVPAFGTCGSASFVIVDDLMACMFLLLD
jgi:hypothetical protein